MPNLGIVRVSVSKYEMICLRSISYSVPVFGSVSCLRNSDRRSRIRIASSRSFSGSARAGRRFAYGKDYFSGFGGLRSSVCGFIGADVSILILDRVGREPPPTDVSWGRDWSIFVSPVPIVGESLNSFAMVRLLSLRRECHGTFLNILRLWHYPLSSRLVRTLGRCFRRSLAS